MEATTTRWELYRLLGEPMRLRLLAIAAEEELAIGELAELVDEAQPNVSRHLKPLRAAKLVRVRKQGTRVFVHTAESEDPVVRDALASGAELIRSEGILERIPAVVEAREAPAKAFFAQGGDPSDSLQWPTELGAYLAALAPLVPRRELAVDVGTGHGGLLDVVAPIFQKVIGVDREEAQLDRARERMLLRRHRHVELLQAQLGDAALLDRVTELGGADAVFAARVLHHASKPERALRELSKLARPGAFVLVVDYAAHQDERLRDKQADAWLGFEPGELRRLAKQVGLCDVQLTPIPAARCGHGPDGHLDWQVLSARRPE